MTKGWEFSKYLDGPLPAKVTKAKAAKEEPTKNWLDKLNTRIQKDVGGKNG